MCRISDGQGTEEDHSVSPADAPPSQAESSTSTGSEQESQKENEPAETVFQTAVEEVMCIVVSECE